MTYSKSPAAVRLRERRAAQRAADTGWTDRRKTAGGSSTSYNAVKRWRHSHLSTARLMDRLYKGMRRSELFKRYWPMILEHYGNRCCRCGSTENIIPDHVKRLLDDPDANNVLANLQPLCTACNRRKLTLCDDYRPDQGAWIVTAIPEACVPLHPKPRTRFIAVSHT